MSSRAKTDVSTEPQRAVPQVSVGSTVREEEIRGRAYEIYLERVEQPGRELDDWLQAEHELELLELRQAS